jgi:L-rhamnose isomerase
VFVLLISTMKQPLIVVSFNNETTFDCCLYKNYGLASEFKVSCLTPRQKLISALESVRSNSNGERNDEIRNNAIEAKQFSINKQFILGSPEANGTADRYRYHLLRNESSTYHFGFWSTQGKFGAVV